VIGGAAREADPPLRHLVQTRASDGDSEGHSRREGDGRAFGARRGGRRLERYSGTDGRCSEAWLCSAPLSKSSPGFVTGHSHHEQRLRVEDRTADVMLHDTEPVGGQTAAPLASSPSAICGTQPGGVRRHSQRSHSGVRWRANSAICVSVRRPVAGRAVARWRPGAALRLTRRAPITAEPAAGPRTGPHPHTVP